MQKIYNIINVIIAYIFYIFCILIFNKIISDPIISIFILNILLISGYIIYIRKKEIQIKYTKIDTKNKILLFSIFLTLFLLSNNISIYLYNHIEDNAFSSYSNILNNSNTIIMILSALIISPIAEEIFFRGIIFKYLRKEFNFIISAIISTLLFVIIHGTLVHIVPGILLGIFFCEVYEYTKDIKYNILCHILYNLLILSIGAFSFIHNIYLIIICGILSLMLLIMYGKYIINYE